MKKALIHIGFPKTGSTSIQNALRSRKHDSSVIYPVFNRHNHNILLPVYYPRERWTGNFIQEFRKRNDDYMKRWMRGYHKRYVRTIRKAQNIIISSEMILSFDPELIRLFKEVLLESGFHDFRVVAYIRRPSDHYCSLMQELMRFRTEYMTPDQYSYRVKDYLTNWSDAFPDSVVCRIYQSSNQDGFDDVEDFFDIADAFFKTRMDRGESQVISNPTIPVEGLILCHRYRETLGLIDFKEKDRRYEQFLNICRRVLYRNDLAVTKPELKSDVADYINSTHTRDIEYLIKTFDLDVSEWLTDTSPDHLPEYDENDFLSILRGYNPDTLEKLTFLIYQEMLKPEVSLLRYLVRYARKKKREFRKALRRSRMMVFGR